MTPDALITLDQLMKGNAVFEYEMPVWNSTFGERTWFFIDKDSPLYTGPSTSAFLWDDYVHGHGYSTGVSKSKNQKYQFCLTHEMVDDLRVAAAIYGKFPNLIKHARSNISEIDPKTVVGRVIELVKFFSCVIKYNYEVNGLSTTSLSDVSFELLKTCIAIYPGRSEHLRRALKLISDPVVQKNISSPLQWQLLDLYSKEIRWSQTLQSSSFATLSDAQFTFLIAYCRQSIRDFLIAVNKPLWNEDPNFSPTHMHGDMFAPIQTYYEYVRNGKKPNSSQFKKNFGISISEVKDHVQNAQSAAMMTILLLTGMRVSEAKFLKLDCRAMENGYWFLKSKVTKQRPKDHPIVDGWLAVDLTMDAYEVLEYVCIQTSNKFLFSSAYIGFSNSNTRGLSSHAINGKLNRWLNEIDIDGLFYDWQFSVHQCRETLVYQLARMEIGLPFISMQLKHFHTEFMNLPNDVTAGYGQYKSELMASITNKKAIARENALLELYGEDSIFAGGGGEEHKARIDTFFSGIGLFGQDREIYIRKMANRGAKLMPTSIGNCTKNFIKAIDGEIPPPCYGDFQCDPDCQSHVITKSSAPALIARSNHVKLQASKEALPEHRILWLGLAEKLDKHISKLN